MKKIIILLILFLLIPPLHIYAGEGTLQPEQEIKQPEAVEDTDVIKEEEKEEVQIDENTKQVSNVYFDLTLEQKPQSAFGNHVPYILTIKPHLNAPRTQIIWNSPSTLTIKPKHKEFVSLTEGEVYTFKANVKPLRTGTYDFSVSVLAWQHDTNYTNSIDDTLVFNSNFVLQPVSIQYRIFTVIKFLLVIGGFIGACYIAIKLVKRYMIKARKWLTPPY